MASGKEHEPMPGNFSVSVTDESRLPADQDNENTILASLLLTSDLKGYVEKPDYYFNGGDLTGTDIDLLMLTQGYHRFEWKQILDGRFHPAPFQAKETASVSGKITTISGKAVPHGKVTLLSVSKVFFSLDTIADANGTFVFKHIPAIDSVHYIIQATEKQVRKNTLIELDRERPPNLADDKNLPDVIGKESGNLMEYLAFDSKFHREQLKQGIVKHTILLHEVTIKEKRERKSVERSSNLNGPGNANEVITAAELLNSSPILTNALAGHLHGIQFIGGDPYYAFLHTTVMIDGIEVIYKQNPLGARVADIINSLNTNDVASIEIITDASRAGIYGVFGGGGLILITMKTWQDDVESAHYIKSNFANYSPIGYYKAKSFYSPKYNVSTENSTAPDLRTTIYWNPSVITGKDGKASIEYFNADNKGIYRVVAEGIDNNGNLSRVVYRYEVN